MAFSYSPSTGLWRLAAPWASLAGQPNLLRELQASEKACLRKVKWVATEE